VAVVFILNYCKKKLTISDECPNLMPHKLTVAVVRFFLTEIGHEGACHHQKDADHECCTTIAEIFIITAIYFARFSTAELAQVVDFIFIIADRLELTTSIILFTIGKGNFTFGTFHFAKVCRTSIFCSVFVAVFKTF